MAAKQRNWRKEIDAAPYQAIALCGAYDTLYTKTLMRLYGGIEVTGRKRLIKYPIKLTDEGHKIMKYAAEVVKKHKKLNKTSNEQSTENPDSDKS